MLTESLRLQFASSTVEFKELEPPAVATDLLPGQRERDPEVREIQVERVKFLRYAESRGDYDTVVQTLNATDPHGSR